MTASSAGRAGLATIITVLPWYEARAWGIASRLWTHAGVAFWPKLVPSTARSPSIGIPNSGTVRCAPERDPVIVTHSGGRPETQDVAVDRPWLRPTTRRSIEGSAHRVTADSSRVAASATTHR